MTVQLILTRGLPASGKTTWAREWVTTPSFSPRARVNRDDLRSMLFAEPTYQWDQEQRVTTVQRETVKTLLASGHDVVCDDTNLRPKYIREWQRFARANGAGIVLREFAIDVDEAIRRDAARDRSIGEDVIRRMVGKYMPKGHFLPIPDEDPDPVGEPYVPVAGSAPAIIVDIDGTVALHGNRSPYDLTRVHEDQPNMAVVEAVRIASAAGLKVIYCSGREDTSRTQTALWLMGNVGVPSVGLFMRAAGDRRKDSVVKRELFDAHIREKYDVRYVFDDRNQVVSMWRELGLTVFQVAEGDF